MLVPVARAPGGTGAAPSPKLGTRGRDRIGVLICAGAAPRWGPWRWLLSCPQLGSCTSWDVSRASWSRYAQGPEGQRPSGHEQAKQRCRGRGALPAGPRSPRDASSIWDHSARWKPGCASRAAKGCSGASLCPHPQLLPPPPQALLWLGSLLPRSTRVQIHPKFTHKNKQRQSQLAGLQPQRAPVQGPVSPRDSVSHAVSPKDSGTAQHPTAPTRHPARATTSYPNQHALPVTALTATAITAPAAFRLRDLRAEAITARTSLPRSWSP